jgi:hypothetical protein
MQSAQNRAKHEMDLYSTKLFLNGHDMPQFNPSLPAEHLCCFQIYNMERRNPHFHLPEEDIEGG